MRVLELARHMGLQVQGRGIFGCHRLGAGQHVVVFDDLVEPATRDRGVPPVNVAATDTARKNAARVSRIRMISMAAIGNVIPMATSLAWHRPSPNPPDDRH